MNINGTMPVGSFADGNVSFALLQYGADGSVRYDQSSSPVAPSTSSNYAPASVPGLSMSLAPSSNAATSAPTPQTAPAGKPDHTSLFIIGGASLLGGFILWQALRRK